jgi:antitoxin VapB
MNIKNAEAEELARRVAALTGESMTAAIVTALRERLERIERAARADSLAEQLNAIALRAAKLPLVDRRSADAILGYDEKGLPR